MVILTLISLRDHFIPSNCEFAIKKWSSHAIRRFFTMRLSTPSHSSPCSREISNLHFVGFRNFPVEMSKLHFCNILMQKLFSWNHSTTQKENIQVRQLILLKLMIFISLSSASLPIYALWVFRALSRENLTHKDSVGFEFEIIRRNRISEKLEVFGFWNLVLIDGLGSQLCVMCENWMALWSIDVNL